MLRGLIITILLYRVTFINLTQSKRSLRYHIIIAYFLNVGVIQVLPFSPESIMDNNYFEVIYTFFDLPSKIEVPIGSQRSLSM